MIAKFRWLPFLCALLSLLILNVIADIIVQNNAHLYVASTDDLRGHQSSNYKQGIPADKRALYFVGGSGMKWSLLNEKDMESVFDDRFTVRNFSHGFQTLIESYAYLKGVGLKQGDVVALHVSTSRVNRVLVNDKRLCKPYFYSISSGDLLDAYDDLNIEAQFVNPLCHISFLTKPKVVKGIMLNAFSETKPNYITNIPQEFESDVTKLKEKRKTIQRKQMWQSRDAFANRWLKINAVSLNTSVGVISNIHKVVSNAGAKLVVIDTPLNKSWFEKYFNWGDDEEKVYNKLKQKLKASGVNYHDLRWDSRFTYDDFYDHQHVMQSGRIKLAPIYRDLILYEKQ